MDRHEDNCEDTENNTYTSGSTSITKEDHNSTSSKQSSSKEDIFIKDDPFTEIDEEFVINWEVSFVLREQNVLLANISDKGKLINDDSEILNEQLNLGNQRVIKNDCDRTRVKDKKLLTSFREYLECFLTFYCKNNNIKYKQGMNEIIGPLVLLKAKISISLSRLYNLFTCFIEYFLTNYYHEDEFYSLQSSMSLVNILLKYHEPSLYNIFEFSLITPEMYATSWVLTIFAK